MTFMDPDEMAAVERELDRVEREHYAERLMARIEAEGGLPRVGRLSWWARLLDRLAG